MQSTSHHSPRDAATGEGFRCVVADDEPDGLFLTTHSLRSALPRLDIIAFERSEAALEFLATHEVDAVVTDHMLGTVSGLELIASARAKSPRAAIVMLSGMDNLAERARAGGADEFVPTMQGNRVGEIVRGLLARR